MNGMNSEKLENSKMLQTSLNEQFLQDVEKLETVEERLHYGLEQMKKAISEDKTPRFKDFWEYRRYCLPLFKENLSSFVRASFWKEFLSLTTEARRLKEILDEQSSFTVEQIDLALDALEKDVAQYQEGDSKISQADLPDGSKALQDSFEIIQTLQGEINLLNTFITRQGSLRKELIDTEMRIRHKNNFFRRISKVGDILFPKRKELIQNLSEQFLKDVSTFVETNFKKDTSASQPYYILKEEIKAIQNVGKHLNLSNKVFTETRDELSACWDQVREVEKVKRKKHLEQREVYLENKQKVQEKIDQLSEKKDSLSFEQMQSEIVGIEKLMKTFELGREEFKDLKRQLFTLLSPFEEKRKEEEERRRKEQEEELNRRKKQIEDLKDRIAKYIERGEELDVKSLSTIIKDIQTEIEGLSLKKYEKQALDRSFKPLRDLLLDLKEKALLNLSKNELKSLENLKQILQDRKQRKKEIKKQLEVYRKEEGSSGLDFEKAMACREAIDMERTRLGTIEEKIVEIEEKIAEIEGR